jgi:hypothetical protein
VLVDYVENFDSLRNHSLFATSSEIVHDKEGVVDTGFKMTVVESVEHVAALMEKANFRRTTSSTSLNEQSSRSHAI